MSKILIVEDDPDTVALVSARLRKEKFLVEVANDGLTALYLMKAEQYDVVVLDLNLPKLNGLEVLTQYRSGGGNCAVILLTTLASVEDKLAGFSRGADDYLPKPFDARELVIRINSLLRRPPAVPSHTLINGHIELDPANHRLTKNSVEVHVQKQDFALLEFFLRHPDETFSPDVLLERVWQNDSMASVQGLRMAVLRLRKALDHPEATTSIIENVPRVGYRLTNQT